jgi:hypothetical protein
MRIIRYPFIIVAAIMLLALSCTTIANHPPIIMGLKAEPEAVLISSSCQIECIASDEDGEELNYEWSASGGGINGNGARVIWTAPDSEGIYNVVVKVTDGRGGEASDSITIPVRVNHSPTITGLIADADWVSPSGSLQVKCDAEDPDGDELGYEWSTSGGDISGTGAVVNWTAPEGVGLYDIQVVVTDDYGAEDTRSLAISVAPNTPPIIEDLIVTAEHKYFKKQSGDYLIGKERSCQIECLASVAWGGELSYGWSASGGDLSGEGSGVTWTAPNRSGEFTVMVIVSDIAGNMVRKSIVFTVVSCSACTFK